ncbi:maternal embryonic leucine zipper kinase-like [Daktulosphaira vitifoliae]|uniref:maternal embryonic leucine zipper kinase-like n=1 Tax=Daktulosphaira vitifoliae TaxID=58002 RepID=UPI0021AAC475|nr:maternal embryonic leucine zipper kinase-like [Daktulosphaira vitifoliae]
MSRYPTLQSNGYVLDRTIGTGGFGKVKLATHTLTGEKVAIKIMDKNKLGKDLPRVKLEISALKSLSHPNICKLYQVIETESHCYVIMEYCSGGELFDHIVEKSRLSEMESRMFFRQIISAVSYLHENGYAHRDLKPENVLLDKDQNLKLIDFGLCAKPQGGMESLLLTSCGSPTYAAPELIQGVKYHGSEVDIWSMGVILYALLCGCLPFESDNIDELFRKILKGKYVEPSWLSSGSKRLLRRMLCVDPIKRIQISELINDPWVKLGFGCPPMITSKNMNHIKDTECLEVMSQYFSIDMDTLWSQISKWRYDSNCAIYLLLINQKKSGCSVSLNKKELPKVADFAIKRPTALHTPGQENRRIVGRAVRRKLDEVTPTVPAKIKRNSNPDTPQQSTSAQNSPAGKILDSIEKRLGLNRVRKALTPRRRACTSTLKKPELLDIKKDLCNISTTVCKDPEKVMNQLENALVTKNIICSRKGFVLRGKLKCDMADKEKLKLSFELEICLVPSMNKNNGSVVAIKRKRLKGDSWMYKKICEEILNFTGKCDTIQE